MIATEAAWRTGDAWLDALLPYLAGNHDLLTTRIERAAPGARAMRLDATYLGWVDFSGTGLPAADVAARVKDRARIFASPGEQFGPGGETWLRFNFATPRPILVEALDRLDEAFRGSANVSCAASSLQAKLVARMSGATSERQFEHLPRISLRSSGLRKSIRLRDSRGMSCPEFCMDTFALEEYRGRREDRVRAAPAVSQCGMHQEICCTTSIQVQRRTLRPSLRNGFTAYTISSW